MLVKKKNERIQYIFFHPPKQTEQFQKMSFVPQKQLNGLTATVAIKSKNTNWLFRSHSLSHVRKKKN